MTQTIQHDQNIILRLPSGAYRVITISPKSHTCSLGKFGSFDANQLIGHQYGLTYEIQEDKSLKVLTVDNLQSLEDSETTQIDSADELDDSTEPPVAVSIQSMGLVDQELANNEFIVDQSRNQGLSHQEIRDLRDNTHDRSKLIEQLQANNKSFSLKTSFSQAKYTKRKMAKFIKRFTTIPATIFDVLQYLLDKDADRVMHVNQETLAYLLNTADIRPGCNYLVVDEASGLLSSAIIEKGANVMLVHDTEHMNVDILKYLPQFSHEDLLASGRLSGLSWEEAVDPVNVMAEVDEYEQRKANSKNSRDHAKVKKRQDLRSAIIKHQNTKYDGLIVMSNHTASSILPYLLGCIKNSRKIVVYSPFREPLLTLRHMDFDGMLLMPGITEVRARAFQVLPGRTRPVMTKRGEYGYVYHAIKVLRSIEVEAVGRHTHKKLEKEAHRVKVEKQQSRTQSGKATRTGDSSEADDKANFAEAGVTNMNEASEVDSEPPVKKARIE